MRNKNFCACFPRKSVSKKSIGKLKLVLFLTTIFMFVEIAGGIFTKSISLSADAIHMFIDVSAISISLFAIWIGDKNFSIRKTFGFYRAEILAVLANSILLFLLSSLIIYKAYNRFFNQVEIITIPMLFIAFIGLLTNLIGIKLLKGPSKRSLNVKSAYTEVLVDAISSIGVIIAAILIILTGVYIIDSLIGFLIGLFIIIRGWKLFSQAINILLESAPSGINVNEVKNEIMSVKGVIDVHDLHIWSITSGMEALACHLKVKNIKQSGKILNKLKNKIREKFNITHTTFQFEE
jgi:cobalt-zinc-cadmium efflux system protein